MGVLNSRQIIEFKALCRMDSIVEFTHRGKSDKGKVSSDCLMGDIKVNTSLGLSNIVYKQAYLKKSLIFLFSFGCLFLLEGLQAQNMYTRTSSNQTTYSLSNIKKFTFSSGNLLVSSISGAIDNYALNTMRYINFKDLSLGTKEYVQATKNILLYPNPVNEVLNLSFTNLIQGAIHIQITTIEGRVVKQESQNNNSNTATISVTGLPSGLYLCKASNGISSETIKFLKQ